MTNSDSHDMNLVRARCGSAVRRASRTSTTEPVRRRPGHLVSADEGGRTPLHFAAGYNYGENAVQALLAGGANLEARDGESRTPLHYALSKAHPEGARVLLAAGADPDSRDTAGWTPLHYGAADADDRSAGTLRLDPCGT